MEAPRKPQDPMTEPQPTPRDQAYAPPSQAEAGTALDVASQAGRSHLAFDDQETPAPPRPYRRRVWLPLLLFLLTCLSTFLAGVTHWNPIEFMARYAIGRWDVPISFLHLVQEHWQNGLIYMGCVLAILLTHEMGHFVMTVVYRIRASYPYFIPLPISPIGTMGAVIGMDGLKANRRQIFDIGLAGPLAGLVVAVPIVWVGISQLDLRGVGPSNAPTLDMPLAMRLIVEYVHPGDYQAAVGVPLDLANPYFMAGWVGLLVTGLNMMPVSQLDGGHVTYALFGRKAHWIARVFMLCVFVGMAVNFWLFRQGPTWLPMALLVLLIGTDHPPTSDDSVKLGWGRTILGVISLAIPIFCFVPNIRL